MDPFVIKKTIRKVSLQMISNSELRSRPFLTPIPKDFKLFFYRGFLTYKQQ
jgi:hypothetical protein